VNNGSKPMTDAVESRKSLEVCLAALKSAREGVPVKLPLEVS
jgi:hypothetical protein